MHLGCFGWSPKKLDTGFTWRCWVRGKLLSCLLLLSPIHSLTERLSNAGVVMASPDYTCSMSLGKCLDFEEKFSKKTLQLKKWWNHFLVPGEQKAQYLSVFPSCRELYKCCFIDHNNPIEHVFSHLAEENTEVSSGWPVCPRTNSTVRDKVRTSNQFHMIW